jgi:hypothetical protein
MPSGQIPPSWEGIFSPWFNKDLILAGVVVHMEDQKFQAILGKKDLILKLNPLACGHGDEVQPLRKNPIASFLPLTHPE